MVFLKALGKWNLIQLSDSRFLGTLNHAQAVHQLYAQRADFISKLPGSTYIEANLGYYGLLDVIPHAFKHHRTIYIIRDGRDWIRSMLNWGEGYGKQGIRKHFSHKWPAANEIPNDQYAEKWNRFGNFEKFCWAWARLNEYALKTAATNSQTCIFHFEKIFYGEGRYEYLSEFISGQWMAGWIEKSTKV
jgi:hypothetical protein